MMKKGYYGFTEEQLTLLEGGDFTNSVKIKTSSIETSVVDRLSTLVELSKGKQIIHLGFADHLPLIKNKIEKNIWLHQLLIESAERCCGLDIEGDTVNYIKDELGVNDIHELDIISDSVPSFIKENKWDYIILGEILEHIDNPVLFLKTIREKYAPYVKKMIITVPNGFSQQQIIGAFRRREFINSDHRFWFTPFTLAKVGIMSGLKFQQYAFCHNSKLYPWEAITHRLFPPLRQGLIMEFELS